MAGVSGVLYVYVLATSGLPLLVSSAARYASARCGVIFPPSPRPGRATSAGGAAVTGCSGSVYRSPSTETPVMDTRNTVSR